MNNLKSILTLIVLFVFIVINPVTAQDENEIPKYKTFEVHNGGTLKVDLKIGSIEIKVWDKNEVRIEIDDVTKEDWNNVKMQKSGNTVIVNNTGMSGMWGFGEFTISIPERFNLQLSTAAGDIEIDKNLTGNIVAKTSGGDIETADVTGNVNLKTSGGDIEVGNIEGEAALSTLGGEVEVVSVSNNISISSMGGDIHVGKVGQNVSANTAGGDIQIGDVGGAVAIKTAGGSLYSGYVKSHVSMVTAGGDIKLNGSKGNATLKTSGGSIVFADVAGTISAKTAAGEIICDLYNGESNGGELSTSVGNIVMYVLPDTKVTLHVSAQIPYAGMELNVDDVIISDFPVETVNTKNGGKIEAVYKINGGGKIIKASTVMGEIQILKQK